LTVFEPAITPTTEHLSNEHPKAVAEGVVTLKPLPTREVHHPIHEPLYFGRRNAKVARYIILACGRFVCPSLVPPKVRSVMNMNEAPLVPPEDLIYTKPSLVK
jgi:hypothetical protein